MKIKKNIGLLRVLLSERKTLIEGKENIVLDYEFFHNYFNNVSLQILEEYLSTETHDENNHQNNTYHYSDEFTHETNRGENTVEDRAAKAEQQEN